MGNCMDVLCHQPAEKSRVIMFNGEEKEFKASIPVKKITSGHYRGFKIVHHALPFSPLPPNAKLEPGELYFLMPPFVKPSSLKVSSKLANKATCTKQKVKIVLTRQQLELLVKNSEFQCSGVALRFSGSFSEVSRKWQPSLATIQEVQKF